VYGGDDWEDGEDETRALKSLEMTVVGALFILELFQRKEDSNVPKNRRSNQPSLLKHSFVQFNYSNGLVAREYSD